MIDFDTAFRFATPEALWLLLAGAAVAIVRLRLGGRPAAILGSFVDLREGGRGLRARLAWLPAALGVLSFVLIVGALARPQFGTGEEQTTREGVAMMIVLDRSISMETPMSYDNRRARRIDVVRSVLSEFLLGNQERIARALAARDRRNPDDPEVVERYMDDARTHEMYLPGREGDLIGLVTFAQFPSTDAPLSDRHDLLLEAAASVRLGEYTGIGDALALAAARLDAVEVNADESDDTNERQEIKSKAIVLLTDGRENYAEIPALEAAELCKELGIRVYAIGIFTDPRSPETDEPTLRRIAEITGGLYQRAANAEALRDVYAQIDELETSSIRRVTYTTYAERFGVLASLGLGCLALRLALAHTLLRRLP